MLIDSRRRAVSIHYLENKYQGAGLMGLMGFGESYAQICLHFWYEDCIMSIVRKNRMNLLEDREQVCP